MEGKRSREDGNPKMFQRQAKVMVSHSRRLVTIKISDGTEFHLHSELLVQHSGYFLKALNSGMSESSSMVFELEEHATELSVGFMVDWLMMVAAKIAKSSETEEEKSRCLVGLDKDMLLAVATHLASNSTDGLAGFEVERLLVAEQ
ncbi:hypothetical protein Micbo1qcDRAFT_206710 [Microdochium bolleyi]|uniref:BTB domain-containing protein n=1 Tax=Microdochium bolleyi TaxID=196109 RepID=A0A136IW36_9PEZI|nr:hypothetical protein Micbo1qcDRAFT_206710 [Microdochium bolleyi]